MLQVLEKIPCPMEKTMVAYAVLLQPMVYHIRADTHTAAHGGPHTAADGYIYMLKETAVHGEPTQKQHPTKICSLWRGAHAGTRILAGTAAHGGAVLEQSIQKELSLLHRPILEQFLNCSPWEGSMLE